MSVVIAVKQGDRVWFGADTQSTRGTDKYNYLDVNDFKLHKLDNGIVYSWTGATRTSQFIEAHREWLTLDTNDNLTKEHIVTQIVPKLYEALAEEDMLEKNEDGVPPTMEGCMLLAFKDKLFEINQDFKVYRFKDYRTTGCGANAIVYGLSKLEKTKPINAQILRLLKLSEKQDSGVSGPFVFVDTKDLNFKVKEG